MPHEATPHVLARRLLTHLRMTTLPPSGPLATAGASLASTIVVIDVPLFVAAARASQAAMPCAALGAGR